VSLAVLRQQLADLVDPPLPDRGEEGVLATGLAPLDRILPGGGIPRGRLTELLGTRGSGRTALVRQLVEQAVADGRWVAYVDAARTLAPREWAHLGRYEGLWVVRPRDPTRGAWSADVLLRSGAFALVVLDGAPPLPRPVAVRLGRLAREHDVALVNLVDEGSGVTIGGALRMRVRRARQGDRGGTRGIGHPLPATGRHPPAAIGRPGREERERSAPRLRITIEKGGPQRTVEVGCAVGMARRLCAHPEVPDRRGVARRPGAAGGERGISADGGDATLAGAGSAGAAGAGHAASRKRRCAEPEVPRDAFVVAAG
jgi:hypothetical protein